MKNPQQTKGYIKVEGFNCSFLYEGSRLHIFEHTVLNDSQKYQKSIKGLYSSGERKWVENIVFEGTTSRNESCLFVVRGNASFDNEFESFEVLYYFKSKNKLSSAKFDGLRLTGEEIDCFYPRNKSIDMAFNTKESFITGFEAKSTPIEYLELGNYELEGINVKLSVYSNFYGDTLSKTPVVMNSELKVEFSEGVDYQFILRIYNNLLNFFSYICRTTDVRFDSVFLTQYKEDRFINIAEFEATDKDETSVRRKGDLSKIIEANTLEKSVGTILDHISRDELYLEHLPPSRNNYNSYSISRIILTFAAFEREYSFSKFKVNRSPDFYLVREEANLYFESKINESKGDRKKYFKGFKKSINTDYSSFEDKMVNADKYCDYIFEQYSSHLYGSADKQTIKKVAKRLNELRNSAVHGNMDLTFEPLNFSDFKFLEILIYSIELRRSGINKEKMIEAINCLFW